MRIGPVARGAPITIWIDGQPIACFAGETVATAMTAQGHAVFRQDGAGMPRGLFCNMGSCGECMVTLAGRRVRACITDVRDGLEIATDG
jgi:predicted molibdopterin-dependent oxidoreductase YjgC